MTQLIAMSFDVATSPSITLMAPEPGSGPVVGAGWGFAWYPGDNLAASVIRDPRPVRDSRLAAVLRDWDRFRGTSFLCHIRGAAKRPSEQDTHPFTRPYAGRDFSFAHNGQLDSAAARQLCLGDDPVFEPLGATDSERAFCWLLTKMRGEGARSFDALGYDRLHAWLRELNELGTLTVILSDGQSTVCYTDKDGHNALHFIRRLPPHGDDVLTNGVVTIDHSDPIDLNRTMLLVATTPLGPHWNRQESGELLVARRASVVHRSGRDGKPLDFAAAAVPETLDDVAPAEGGRVEGATTGTFGSTQTQHAANGTTPAAETDESVRRYRVLHETLYEYEEPVERSTHMLRLEPQHTMDQRVLESNLEISAEHESRVFDDVFGNRTTKVWIESPYDKLRVLSTSIVEVRRPETPSPRKRTTLPMVWMPWQRQMMMPFLLPAELPESQLRELSGFAMSFADRQDYDVAETLRDINESIRRDFAYVQGSTNIETTPFEVYVSRRGVCQDFANLFICLARLLGVPARYRVGYIHTGTDYDNQLQSEASHAWAEVYLPWVGWRGYDPTNGCLASLDHVCVASGRNYRDATPTSGTLYKGGKNERLSVRVELQQLPNSQE